MRQETAAQQRTTSASAVISPLADSHAIPWARRNNLQTAADKNGMAVCVLDDDPSVLKATGRLIAASGWNVESFTDPLAFLSYAERHRPPVAVIDIWMPVMNGLQVQTRLRNLSPSTRVIVVTGKDDPVVRSTAINAGASGFFLKPIGHEEFLAGIQSALSET